MKLIKISQQYQTKDGRSITFEDLPFNEATDKRGWVFHRINAYVDGEVAGHITPSYIPRDRWESIYQGNLWKFKDLSLGRAHMPNELIDSGNDKAIAKYIDENYSYINGENWVIYEKEKAKRQYDTYEAYFVDKPIVDFINTENNFKRQGIATALHQYASKWLQDNFGLKLFMSTLLTDEGKPFYEKAKPTFNLKKYRSKKKLAPGFSKEREYMAKNNKWRKESQTQPDNLQTETTELFLSQFKPISLVGLAAEALKCNSFEEFERNFLREIKHGTYWHITDNPNFTIDPKTGPRDMSSLITNPTPSIGRLMITSHLENWIIEYPDRKWAAEIDMSNVDTKDYYQVNRGFGNEFIVTDPSKAKVIRVVPIKNAIAIARYRHNKLPQNEESLKMFYENVKNQYDDFIRNSTPGFTKKPEYMAKNNRWNKISKKQFDIDELMLKGWGAANQLPESNYARKAWDVAFRIAMAATPKQKDIAIRELISAAKIVLQELWKIRRINNPIVQEYARKLTGVMKLYELV